MYAQESYQESIHISASLRSERLTNTFELSPEMEKHLIVAKQFMCVYGIEIMLPLFSGARQLGFTQKY